MKIKARQNGKSKIVNNASIVRDILYNAQESFINGTHISQLDVAEIHSVVERIFNVNDNVQYANALSVVERVIDKFMDWLYAHCDDNGYYSEEVIRYGGYIKSGRQLERDLCDTGRKGILGDGRWCQTDLYCEHLRLDAEGNEYLDFEVNNKLTTFTIENRIVDKVLAEDYFKILTEEERKILFYRLQGKTLEECSELTGLTYKQVRGRQNAYRQKQQEFYNNL